MASGRKDVPSGPSRQARVPRRRPAHRGQKSATEPVVPDAPRRPRHVPDQAATMVWRALHHGCTIVVGSRFVPHLLQLLSCFL